MNKHAERTSSHELMRTHPTRGCTARFSRLDGSVGCGAVVPLFNLRASGAPVSRNVISEDEATILDLRMRIGSEILV